jgi:hypothetical protein
MKRAWHVFVITGLTLTAFTAWNASAAEAGWLRPARVQSEDGIVTLRSRRSLVEIDRHALPPGSPPGAIRIWPPQVRVYRIAQ